MKATLTIELTAIPFRSLNSFEWAVLSVLAEFPDAPPSLVEASDRLCIHCPEFLRGALECMRVVGAVESPAETEAFDLTQFRLTDSGRAILQTDGWEQSSSEHFTDEIAAENRSAVTTGWLESRLRKETGMEWRVTDFFVCDDANG